MKNFEPFLGDEITFDRHLELLSQDATFGGRESLTSKRTKRTASGLS